MASRVPPTERQRRLGAELRKMREHVGLTINEAAAIHRTDRTTVSNTESGRFGVSPDRVRVWAANYSCPEPDYVDALADMARERRAANVNWWDEYRDFVSAPGLDLAELEHYAVAMRSAQITHMPGLLQHEDYARAVIEQAVPPLAPENFARTLAFRMRRSEVLDRENPPHCVFILHEAALRMRFGGDRVVRAQFAHLLRESERESVELRVLPFAAGGFPAAASSTLYAYGPVTRLDTVQTDTPVGSSYLHAETHLANYRDVLDRMEHRSLSPSRSRDFIQHVVQEL
ncbi:Scr1 family TA system antitoxin-like transcriptional regulator [Streptomyces daliensis]|uniref:Helix-turn-helix transcriptional regulator n=1 Tax=Streptomyces daliensis TaxID=299421 RepID=A0A8T4J4R2_9ACTN|nr:helix-turn-helix transcriptional regulator [Streptomyces daliensis]